MHEAEEKGETRTYVRDDHRLVGQTKTWKVSQKQRQRNRRKGSDMEKKDEAGDGGRERDKDRAISSDIEELNCVLFEELETDV